MEISAVDTLITHATGWEFDKDRLWECFLRNRNLVRALNVRLGLRRPMERPPEDHWAVRNEEYEQHLLTKYYDFKGWTFDGIPTKETLEKVDLGYVAEDLISEAVAGGFQTIAKGRRGLGKAKALLLGSVTNKVVQNPRGCAVAVVA